MLIVKITAKRKYSVKFPSYLKALFTTSRGSLELLQKFSDCPRLQVFIFHYSSFFIQMRADCSVPAFSHLM